jgi:peptidoglycan/LPS O-acetylase OafA/YrhL
LGILLIVLHNFFHNLKPVIGENEFTFSPDIFWNFYHVLQLSPENCARALFSYFGHYGVQIFIFFSAYGLTRKYYRKPLIIRRFLADRINKIYFSFLLCVAIYILLGGLKAEFMPGEKVLYWDSLLWKVLLVSSFIPGQALMPVGPWWFMPFIFQVYLLFPWLLKGHQKWGDSFLMLVSVAALATESWINPYLLEHGLNLNYTVFGHLTLLCLGLFFASRERIKIRGVYAGLSLLLFILGSFNAQAWMVSNITFTVFALSTSATLFNLLLLSNLATRFFIFFGNISFHLFMVNGFLRTPFHRIAESYDHWWMDNLAALASLLFSTMCAYGLGKMDHRLRVMVRPKP